MRLIFRYFREDANYTNNTGNPAGLNRLLKEGWKLAGPVLLISKGRDRLPVCYAALERVSEEGEDG